jgi:hypothetical protein
VTLVDRYVAEVARRLPRRRRADISRELRSTLLDTLESRFGTAGGTGAAGAFSDEHAADVLREFGPPEKVAASYQPANQYLIGPEWYAPFSTVLRIYMYVLVGALVAGFGLAIFVPSLTTNVGRALGALLSQIVHIGLLSFGAIVLVFHLLERGEVAANWPIKPWNPLDLPDTRARDLVGRGEALTIIVITAAYLVVLFQIKNQIGLTLADGRLLLNDVVRDNLLWMAAVSLLTMGQYAVLLWQGRWHWYTRATKFLFDAFGVYVVYRIATGVLAQQSTLLDAGVAAPFVRLLMQIAMTGPGVAAALVGIDALKMLWRAWFDRDPDVQSNGGVATAGQGTR